MSLDTRIYSLYKHDKRLDEYTIAELRRALKYKLNKIKKQKAVEKLEKKKQILRECIAAKKLLKKYKFK